MKVVIARSEIDGLKIKVSIETDGIEAIADEICKRLRVEICVEKERCGVIGSDRKTKKVCR